MPRLDLAQLLTFLQVAVGIGLLIFIHELGHFLAARQAGVRVEVFSLGFGRRIWGFRRGTTDYQLCLVPLGGYVKVAGEVPLDSMGAGDELCSKPFRHRAFFFSGGVLMNLLLALLLFPLVFSAGVTFEAPRISEPAPGTPAWEAELRGGDKILRVGDKDTYSFDNLRVELALADNKGVDLLVADQGGQQRTVRVVPRYQPGEGIQTIGILPAVQSELHLDVDPGGPAAQAGVRTGDLLLTLNGQKLDALGAMRALADLEQRPGASPLDLSVQRDGEVLHLRVTPRPREGPATLGVRPTTRTVRGLRLQLDEVRSAGLQRGDEILAVDGRPLFQGSELRERLPESGTARLTVRRGADAAPMELRLELRDAAARDRLVQGIGLQDADHPEPLLVVMPDSAAAQAGLRSGDRVLSLDQRAVRGWDDIYEFISDYRRLERTEPITLAIERPGTPVERLTLQVTPRRERALDHGLIPQPAYATEVYRVPGLLAAVRAGCVCSVDLIKQLVVTLKKITTGDVSPRNLGGIITISRASYQFAKGGWARFLFFLALLSINLAFINVLPIPILDGGHLMFLLIEKVKGSPVSERTLTYAQLVGMVFIVTLMVYVTYNDLQRTELFTFVRNLFRG